MNVDKSESKTYVGDTNKTRQILASLSIVLLYHNDMLTGLLDSKSFNIITNNEHILQAMSYWLKDPDYAVTRSETFIIVENILITFLKRAVNKNKHNRVGLVKDKYSELRISFEGHEI